MARWVVGLAACLCLPSLQAQPCRIAFDLGSSGVRSAASGLPSARHAAVRDIDLLTPLMTGQPLEPLLPAIETALRELPQQAQWPDSCQKMAGGFSAWRLAWRQDGERLVRQLEALRQRTGVAILIIPASTEGQYGHASALQTLGPRLATSHVLDIGGGSMQVGGVERSYGVELGQKSWHHMLCREMGRAAEPPCALQPLTPRQLEQARRLLDEQLSGLSGEVGSVTLTAISRPVTRGIRQALRALGAEVGDAVELQDLRQAIDRLAALDLPETARASQSPTAFVQYLLTDMLLVEGVFRATGTSRLALAEAPINNLPALLRDQRAYDWAERHGCYLERLRKQGLSAYFSNPSDCGSR